jgi:hypothetical protein
MMSEFYKSQARAARYAAKREPRKDVAAMLKRNAKAYSRMAANAEMAS